MTFPTHHAPDDQGPVAPAGDDAAAAEPTADLAVPSAGGAEHRGDTAAQRRSTSENGDSEAAQHGGPAEEPGAPARPWEAWETGVRVMVRTRLPQGSSHLYTDVLGTVVARTAASLTIETRSGTVEVPLASVATGKTVPPAPPRRRPREV